MLHGSGADAKECVWLLDNYAHDCVMQQCVPDFPLCTPTKSLSKSLCKRLFLQYEGATFVHVPSVMEAIHWLLQEALIYTCVQQSLDWPSLQLAAHH